MKNIDTAVAKLILRHFRGREDVVAVRTTGDPFPERDRKPLDPTELHKRHLSNGQRLGFYFLRVDNTVLCSCSDFDDHEKEPNPNWREQVTRVAYCLLNLGVPFLVEVSSSGNGAHIWIFFSDPVPAKLARSFWATVFRGLDMAAPEVFPKQDKLGEQRNGKPPLGNLVWYPLSGKSHFVDIEHDWAQIPSIDALANVRQISGCDLRAAIESLEPVDSGEIESRQRSEERVYRELTSDEMREMVECIPNNALHYDEWLEIGQAIHDSFPGGDGLEAFISFSAKCPAKFDENDCRKRWASFTRGGGRRIGTAIHHAKRDGWRPPNTRVSTFVSSTGGKLERFSLDDIGNARRFAAAHGDDLRFCHPWGKWLVWNRERWIIDEIGEVARRAKAVIIEMYHEIPGLLEVEQKGLIKHIQASSRRDRINAMVELAKSEPGIPILPAQLDADTMLLNLPNGTLELGTATLREHRREDYITKLCPTKFDPDAPSLTFDRFLEAVTGDNDELIGFLQCWFGYCLTGSVEEQAVPVGCGGGSNGKSTLLRAVMDVVGGDYWIVGARDMLLRKKQSGHSTERMDLFGKRLVVSFETGEGRRLDEELVKALSGSDKVRGRRMREDNWEFDPTHKLTLVTNHEPIITGTDDGIWRRIRLIPFNVKFWDPAEGETGPDYLKRDKSMAARLRDEAEGILAWMVRGCFNWRAGGLGTAGAVSKATAEYRSESDVVGRFLDDRCIVGDGFKASVKALDEAFDHWAAANGEFRLSWRKVGSELKRKGFESYSNNGMWYRRLALKPISELTE